MCLSYSPFSTFTTLFANDSFSLNVRSRPSAQSFLNLIKFNSINPICTLLNKTSSLGSACQGIDQGPEFGVWLGKFLDKEHLNFKLIWHNYSNKTSSRELRPLIDELRPMTKQEDLPLFANFYGFLLVNEESVTSLNQALKSVWQYRSQSFKLWDIELSKST